MPFFSYNKGFMCISKELNRLEIPEGNKLRQDIVRAAQEDVHLWHDKTYSLVPQYVYWHGLYN